MVIFHSYVSLPEGNLSYHLVTKRDGNSIVFHEQFGQFPTFETWKGNPMPKSLRPPSRQYIYIYIWLVVIPIRDGHCIIYIYRVIKCY